MRTRKKKEVIRIKPCPKCKQKTPTLENNTENEKNTFFVTCPSCSEHGESFENKREAIDQWNNLPRKRGKFSKVNQIKQEFNERKETNNRFFSRRIFVSDHQDTDCLLKEIEQNILSRTRDNKIICPTIIIIKSFDPGEKFGDFVPQES